MELSDLPTVNAGLNGLAATLLLLGLDRIKRGQERAHKSLMLSAFGVSSLFLACYLYYHLQAGRVSYSGAGWDRTLYLGLLLSHTVLAAAVPVLAVRTIWLGLRGRRAAHRKWAKITFPIWLYVSVTGVLIYLILYHWTDSAALAQGGAGAP